jgi:hypothetical protein
MHRRHLTVFVVGVVATVTIVACPRSADAKRKKPSPWQIESVTTPIGLQGASGAGANIVIPFSAVDPRGRPVDVEVQYAYDRNGDGMIYDAEYLPATEDRLDWRNTRSDRAPQRYPTASGYGVWNAFVWNSNADLGRGNHAGIEYAMTPQGRFIPDPNNPGAFLFANFFTSGIKVRIRTFLRARKHGPVRRGEWVYTDTFGINNSLEPSMTIDSVASGDHVVVGWTAYDGDSEDLNGNGTLDIGNGEDIDGDGVLDCERVGVAFDWHRLAAGEDPAAMTDAQLEALTWKPCTRVADEGDTDSLDARPGVPVPIVGPLSGVCSAPPGVGRQWTFVWDAVKDGDVTTDGYILRARPFDEERNLGQTVYSRVVVHTGQ